MSSREPLFNPLTIYMGQTFRDEYEWLNPDRSPVNLTGMRFLAEFRDSKDPGGKLLETLDSQNETIFIDPLVGVFALLMSSDHSQAITYVTAWYDLFTIDSQQNRDPLFYGPVKIIQNMTRFS